MTKNVLLSLVALALAGGPALAAGGASDAPLRSEQALGTAQQDFDPFAELALVPGDTLPPLACMSREKFSAALAAHDGSKLVTLTPTAAAFYRGLYAAQPFTPQGYPIGDKVQVSVKVMTDDSGDFVLRGVAVFTLGDYLVCNRLPLEEKWLDQIWQAGGARAKDAM